VRRRERGSLVRLQLTIRQLIVGTAIYTSENDEKLILVKFNLKDAN
jgi:hypothetical protein